MHRQVYQEPRRNVYFSANGPILSANRRPLSEMFRIFAAVMKRLEAETKQEVVIYGILWGLVFLLVPAVMSWQGHSEGVPFRVGDMLRVWPGILPFFFLFLTHDLLAAPLLVKKGKVGAYAVVTVVLLFLFGGCVWTGRRGPEPMRPEMAQFREGLPPMDGDRPPMAWGAEGAMPPPPEGGRPAQGRGMPVTPEVMKILLGMLLLGANLGVKYYLKSLRGERKMQALKAENLNREQETQVLRERVAAMQTATAAVPETLAFKVDYKTVRIEPDRIRYAESMSEYLKIWLTDAEDPLVVLYSLKRLAEQLPAGRFQRIHRSYLVNLSLVREFTRTSVILEGGVTLPVSDLYRPALREALGKV